MDFEHQISLLIKIKNNLINFVFYKRDVAQPGSVHAWGACGRWFESSHPDKKSRFLKTGIYFKSKYLKD